MKDQQEILTSLQMYRSEVFNVLQPDRDEEREIVACARQGDEQARTALIESCLRYVMVVAGGYKKYVYHDTYLDLVGVGNLAIVEGVDHALTVDNPCAYLRGIAKKKIMDYAFRRSNLVMKTYQEVDSLDTPDYDEGEMIIADLLTTPESETEPQDYTWLYDALEKLSESQREILARHYGLYGRRAESLYQISRDISKKSGPKSSAAYLREYRALNKLRRQFEHQLDVAA